MQNHVEYVKTKQAWVNSRWCSECDFSAWLKSHRVS